MKIYWNRSWNLVEAVTRLALDSTFFDAVGNHESWLHVVVKDQLEGRFGRLNEREDMKPVAEVLPKICSLLMTQMAAVGLDKEANLPPVVWIRLMREGGIKPVDQALRQFDGWQARIKEDGKAILYLRLNEITAKYVGPSREREGLGLVRGFSIEELLAEEKQQQPYWPYSHEWKCAYRRLKRAGKQSPAKMLTRITDVSTQVQLENFKPRASPRKRCKRSLQTLVRACGSRLVAALEDCLTSELAAKKSAIQAGGRNRRKYDSQLSLDELVRVLKKKYGSKLTYADSTLKSALPRFVSCPRGRPGGLA
ncbi:hypothetical protein [Rhodoferax sp. PAMC 29310]|uniref:hypothetical protein n=1 Tax=Rhodoferax sp. PAMC 29310 TaxID=2822760 RepID=UPI001B3323C7|nr:hypothetical protein [Rhodoferax sp. PAMC 29310]